MSAFVPIPGMILDRDIELYPEGIILPVDKPYRWTSADVIRKIKWTAGKHFGKKNIKVGHAGTLDPLATGMLLVCIGKATKLAEELQGHEKEYLAGVSFGATTASYDLEKDVDNVCSLEGVSEESLNAVLPQFIGEQMQVAPLFSAKSVDGVRAYETARRLYKQGRLDDAGDLLTASRINISLLSVARYCPPSAMSRASLRSTGLDGLREDLKPNPRINVADVSGYELAQAEILVRCSKGTYIRALARDLGEALGSGAFLHSLRRMAVGGFRIENALTMEQVMELF